MSANQPKEQQVYHALELRAENFKRLKAIAIKLNEGVTEIKGRNKQGKSTIADLFEALIGGARAIPKKPLRKGEDHGFGEVVLGHNGQPLLKVTRVFNAEGKGQPTTLRVESADGGSLRSPQAVIDALRVVLIDPLKFMELDDGEQVNIVRQLVPGIDFEAVEALNRGDHDRRQDVNRDLKSAKAQLAAIQIPGDPRHQRIDEAALVAELQKAGETATEIERERARRQDAMRSIRSHAHQAENYRDEAQAARDRIAVLRAELERLEADVTDCTRNADACDQKAAAEQAAVEALPPLAIAPDTTEITNRLGEARARNRQVDDRERAMAQRETLAKRIDDLAAKSQGYTDAMEQRKQQIAEAITKANLPIPGLSLGELDGESRVLLNDLPLSQASSGEQIDVSIGIQVALAPQIRVAFVKNASMLDKETERHIIERCAERDLQLLLEKVADENDGVGIYIEDGRVKAAGAAA